MTSPHTSVAAAPTARPATARTSWVAWGWFARIVVGVFFVLVATGKIADPLHFAEQIQGYRLLPVASTHALALILPWVELLAGVLLLVPSWRGAARLLLLAMLVVFTVAKLTVELRGLHIDCGCFGRWLAFLEPTLSGRTGLLMNVALIGLLVVDWLASRRPSGPRGPRISINN